MQLVAQILEQRIVVGMEAEQHIGMQAHTSFAQALMDALHEIERHVPVHRELLVDRRFIDMPMQVEAGPLRFVLRSLDMVVEDEVEPGKAWRSQSTDFRVTRSEHRSSW